MVTLIICLSISCAIILLKEKSNYPDNHLLMTYLVILLFAVMAISLITCGCLLCERLWVRRNNRNYKP
jgi:hypothetical protein